MNNQREFWYAGAFLVAVGVFLAPPRAGAADARLPDTFKAYPSLYYDIYTDLSEDMVREISVHMTRMAEEYRARTAGFSGEVRARLPFYVFSKPEDYTTAGGMPGSAGVFNGKRLMAIAGANLTTRTWHVIQHEGFHQFARAVIGGDLPVWVNEGLAEYFGEAIFTGDGFVAGIVPPYRLGAIKDLIAEHKYKSMQGIMRMDLKTWNAQMTGGNYDQAWSMVHFLAHARGADGKPLYQQAFVSFMNAIARGTAWDRAWIDNFGSAAGFEERWIAYWTALPDNPTADLYAQADVATLTSFLARACAQRLKFASYEKFIAAAEAGDIKLPLNENWLPPSMLAHAARAAPAQGTWSLLTPDKVPQLVLTMADQTRMVGTFELNGTRISKVKVAVDDSAPAMSRAIEQARKLMSENKKNEARKLLQDALSAHKQSALAEEARKVLHDIDAK